MLRYLDLSNNKISGSVPNWLHEVDYGSSPVFLNLSRNLFTSMKQFSWNHWPNLHRLDLSDNLLTGDISLSICNASGLIFLSWAYNQLTGTIPQCLANLSFLEVLDVQMNKFMALCQVTFQRKVHLRV